MKKSNGFTLIEMMITVAIIAILASFAYPAYDQYVTRSKRAEAMAALMNASQAMERYRSTHYSYKVPNLSDVYATQVPVEGGTPYYDLSIVADTGSYTLTASPVGSMAGKKTLTIDHTGAKTWGGEACWPKGNEC